MRESNNPAEIAAQATRAGFFQDVVVASSRLLHDEAPSDDEREALRRSSQILAVAASSKTVLRRSVTQELSESSARLAVIRAAGDRAADSEFFASLRAAIDGALRGKRDESITAGINMVRDLFLAVNEASLYALVKDEQGRQSSPALMSSNVNSIS